jgi:hypothetical protein
MGPIVTQYEGNPKPGEIILETRLEANTSREAEGPGPVTLRQPTERRGGNARIDEEGPRMQANEPEPVVFGVAANATDDELHELAEVLVAALDQRAADHSLFRSGNDRRP